MEVAGPLGTPLGLAQRKRASPRGEAEDSTFLSSHDTDLLEPTEWTQGCRASSSVWREDSGLLSRSGRKRRPSSRDDGGISWVSSGCGARGGFLTRHDEDLREPLVRRQGSQVSMRVARGSTSWHSSHWRGRGSQAPRRAVCGTRGSLRTMHGGGSAPSCCAFTEVLVVPREKTPTGATA